MPHSVNPPLSKKDNAVWDEVLKDMKASVEVARRVNAKWMTVVPGNLDEGGGRRLEMGYQTANAIELLRRCCESIRERRIGYGFGTVELVRQSWRRVSARVSTSLPDLQSGQSPFLQNLVRHLSSTNYRRQLDSQYRLLLG